MSLRTFLHDSRHVQRDAFVYNGVATGLFALQSLVMLLVTQNVLGETAAGMVSIGLAVAVLMGCIGTFGVARYQASDVAARFSFAEYAGARVVTIGAMWVAVAVYLLVKAYEPGKSWVILLFCLLKTVDVAEDVVLTHFQQQGRLDIGSRASAIRYAVSIIVFTGAILVSRDLVGSLVVTVVVTGVVLGLLVRLQLRGGVTAEMRRFGYKAVARLLGACSGLFVAWFLAIYVNNAARYAIDAQMDDVAQAVFGFLSMPTFVVSLAAVLIFNPVVHRLSVMWQAGERGRLARWVGAIAAAIIGVGAVVAVGGYVVGLPLLSWLYATDLSAYLGPLMILLLAGTFVALAGFFYTVLTILRKQVLVASGYVAVSLFAVLAGGAWVRTAGLTGASWLYAVMTGALVVIFGVGIGWTLVRRPTGATGSSAD